VHESVATSGKVRDAKPLDQASPQDRLKVVPVRPRVPGEHHPRSIGDVLIAKVRELLGKQESSARVVVTLEVPLHRIEGCTPLKQRLGQVGKERPGHVLAFERGGPLVDTEGALEGGAEERTRKGKL